MNVKRKETKYYINKANYYILKTLLAATMEIDKHSNEDGEYYIRSLYFDSFNNRDIKEKDAGITHRRKIRLRYYDLNPDVLKLEVKEKFNRYTIKKTNLISDEDARNILDYDLSKIEATDKKLYNYILTNAYSPAVIIDYEREAYVSDLFNIRINFDKNIRGCKQTDDPFSDELTMIPLIEPDMYILEVKHNGHLPGYLQQILASVDLTSVSYSKYYLGGLL